MDPIQPVSLPPAPNAGTARETARPGGEAAMRAAAQEFEAAFLAEMLKHSGINKKPEAFGGGSGEDAFGSMLTSEYARLLAERGGIGLAEQIFETLKQRNSGQ